MRRHHCSACGHEGLDQFLDLGESPVADAYTDTVEEAISSPRYPLQVAVCNKCYLVQLLEVLPSQQLFGTGYSFYTSASPPLSAYNQDYARDVLHAYQSQAQKFTLEIGCNDGDLLRHFSDAGCTTLGVDPAMGPVSVAWDRGLDVRVRPFSLAFARDLHDNTGPASLILANHVLAHVADVSDMLAGISHMLANWGCAIIEVQYLPDLLVNNAFDLVYHEHRNFFSLTSLETAALRHGLYLIDVSFTNRQGGSIRATFSKAPFHFRGLEIDTVTRSEGWLQGLGPYEGFQGRADRIKERLMNLLYQEIATSHAVVGYGAPAKATTLMNFCNMVELPYVVDTTKAKQGRFIPGVGTQILAPHEHPEPDTYVLLAWNYLSTIIRNHPLDMRWIIPIPAPVLL